MYNSTNLYHYPMNNYFNNSTIVNNSSLNCRQEMSNSYTSTVHFSNNFYSNLHNNMRNSTFSEGQKLNQSDIGGRISKSKKILNELIEENSSNSSCSEKHTKQEMTNEKVKKKKSKSNKDLIVENFESLEELLDYLKGGKQIGNFIKCRKSTDGMINLLKKLSSEKIDYLIKLIKSKLKDIIISNNKFSQKLFECCNEEQRIEILFSVKDNIVEISLNKWGIFSMQSFIKNSTSEKEMNAITECVRGNIIKFIVNKRGNLILQKIFNNYQKNKFPKILFDEILNNFDKLIYNPLGINLIKNIVSNNNENKELIIKLITKLNERLLNILNLSAGCVLLSQILDKCDYEYYTKYLILKIFNQFDTFCTIKTASFLLCKCLTICKEDIIENLNQSFIQREKLLQLFSFEGGKKLLINILNNQKIKKIIKASIISILTDYTIEERKNNPNRKENSNINTVNEIIKFLAEFPL